MHVVRRALSLDNMHNHSFSTTLQRMQLTYKLSEPPLRVDIDHTEIYITEKEVRPSPFKSITARKHACIAHRSSINEKQTNQTTNKQDRTQCEVTEGMASTTLPWTMQQGMQTLYVSWPRKHKEMLCWPKMSSLGLPRTHTGIKTTSMQWDCEQWEMSSILTSPPGQQSTNGDPKYTTKIKAKCTTKIQNKSTSPRSTISGTTSSKSICDSVTPSVSKPHF